MSFAQCVRTCGSSRQSRACSAMRPSRGFLRASHHVIHQLSDGAYQSHCRTVHTRCRAMERHQSDTPLSCRCIRGIKQCHIIKDGKGARLQLLRNSGLKRCRSRHSCALPLCMVTSVQKRSSSRAHLSCSTTWSDKSSAASTSARNSSRAHVTVNCTATLKYATRTLFEGIWQRAAVHACSQTRSNSLTDPGEPVTHHSSVAGGQMRHCVAKRNIGRDNAPSCGSCANICAATHWRL